MEDYIPELKIEINLGNDGDINHCGDCRYQMIPCCQQVKPGLDNNTTGTTRSICTLFLPKILIGGIGAYLPGWPLEKDQKGNLRCDECKNAQIAVSI